MQTINDSSAVSVEDHTFSLNDQAPGLARLFVRSQLLTWDVPGFIEPVQLITSELVTNAVRHGGGDFVGVRLECSGRAVVIRVLDHSRVMPRLADPAAGIEDESGRGLMITQALSSRWGAYPSADGAAKVVFAVITGEEPC